MNNPGLLAELRRATKGTVDDLTLMQSAVRADKFKIPLNNLANLLKFARQRAKETGQSVTELSDKIINGIGKQATGAFDELGLKQKDIQREFAITGDFAKAVGNIVSREMKNSGEEILSNAEKVEQLRVSWQNFKEDVGAALVDSVDDLDGFGAAVSNLLAKINPMFGALKSGIETMKAFEEQQDQNNKAVSAGAEIFSRFSNTLLNTTALSLAEISERLKELTAEFELATDPKIQQALAIQIQRFQQMKKAIEDLLTAAPAGTIRALEKRLADIAEKMVVTDPNSLLFAQLSRQADLLSSRLDTIKKKFDSIVFTITTSPIETSTEKIARGFYNISQALDEVNADLRITQTEFIKLSDGTMIKGLQTNEVLTTQQAIAKSMELQRLQMQQNAEAAAAYAGAIGSAFNDLAGLAKEGSATQILLAEISILASYAQAIASAVAAANASGLATGAAAIFTTPTFIASLVASTVTAFAASFATLNKAKALQSSSGEVNAVAFAEGEVDIHRSGETRGKDSIPAVIMPGESVITSARTSQYKPVLEAIHAGSLEELIRVNYIEPALAMQALDSAVSGSVSPDYSDRFYRQYLATGEGNVNGKRMVHLLGSIDKKLTPTDKRYSR